MTSPTMTLPDGWRENPAVAARVLETLQAAKDARTPRARVWESPGELAAALDPSFRLTPALDLINRAVVDAYRTPDARVAISIAPQEGKSTLATKFGTLWAMTENPDRRVGIASYSAELSTGFSREVRNLITQYGGLEDTLDLRLRVAADSAAASRWQVGGRRGGVYAVGVGGSLTGKALDALIIDDPFKDAEQANSEAYRKKVWEWWLSVAATRLAPGAPVIVILTRWHEDDLVGRLTKAEDGALWRIINIPAQADHDPEKGQTDPLDRQPGEWFESARGRTVAQWESIKVRSGARVFNALYQGRPSPDTGNVWRKQWWRRYDTPMWHTLDGRAYLVDDVDEMLMSWDMSFKDTKSSDYVVGQVWARRGANAYLLDMVRARLSFTGTLPAFEKLAAKWPGATVKLVEDKANGSAVIDTLKNKIPGIIPTNPTDSKYGRTTAVSPFIEARNVWLPTDEIAFEGCDIEALIDEAAIFPNGAHDDMVDATSQALARMFIDGSGATAWLDYLTKKLEQVAAGQIEPEPELVTAAAPLEAAVPLTDAEILRAARTAQMFRP